MQRIERFVEIDAPVEQVFDRFSDFENFPRWMRNIREVRLTGRGVTHWVSETALPDLFAEWDAEITVFEPDRRVVWRSVRGDIDADGEAVFSVTPEGLTHLRVVLGFDTPLGHSGPEASRFFGVHLGHQLEEDLRHFRGLVERERAARRGRREDGRRDDGRRGEQRRPFAPVVAEGTRGRAGEPPRRERVSAPLDARRRRATDELSRERRPERDEARGARRRGEDYDEGRRREDARRHEDVRGHRDARERDHDAGEEEYRPRYALTPRERERERGEVRRFDPRVAERFQRRGVDRLMDESPSRRWPEDERERR
jgi:uncharacterized protein YndB with AHSA1/START domain